MKCADEVSHVDAFCSRKRQTLFGGLSHCFESLNQTKQLLLLLLLLGDFSFQVF
jgi:hypothetical protein